MCRSLDDSITVGATWSKEIFLGMKACFPPRVLLSWLKCPQYIIHVIFRGNEINYTRINSIIQMLEISQPEALLAIKPRDRRLPAALQQTTQGLRKYSRSTLNTSGNKLIASDQ